MVLVRLWRPGEAVDAVEVDGGGLEDPAEGPRDGHRVPVATVLANGAGET